MNKAGRTMVFSASAAALLAALLSPGSARADGENRAGPWMANFKLGGAIEVANTRSQFAMQLDAGYEVVKHGYVTFSPQIQLGEFTTLILPAGFQYEFGLPVKNLYVYPAVQVGAGIAFVQDQSRAAFHAAAAGGAKYYFHDRFYAGLEPLGFQFLIGEGDPSVQYRVLAYAGANF